ncbi:MAG: zinc dependent phospholipase C family protein, partial [Defluviitaleaceae bacterium]|nr:zinc dependent phospholipase C family protein [Defluviitaleaceae bacterium]
FLWARSRGVGSQIHRERFGPFFMHMARWARQDVIFAYLAGFLTHYAVDVAAHPFVNGYVKDEGVTPMQGSAAHRHLETTLDVLMLARLTGKKPADINQGELIEAPQEQKQAAAIVFSEAVQKIYDRPLQPHDVYHAMGYMARFTRMLNSPTGKKKKYVESIEDRIAGARILSAMVHMQEVEGTQDHLNLSRFYWAENRNDSFPTIFEAAVQHATQMVTRMYDYRAGNLTHRELAALIGNYSLVTGEPC